MITEISKHVSETLGSELNYDEEKKEIVAYGLESFMLALFGFLAIILFAFLLGAVLPAIVATIAGGSLRKLSGGAHFNTPWKCVLSGAIVYALLGFAAQKLTILGLFGPGVWMLLLTIALLLVVLLAPVDSEAKPIHSKAFRRKLKIASMGLIIAVMIGIALSTNQLGNTSAVLGISYQSITLLPVFNKK